MGKEKNERGPIDKQYRLRTALRTGRRRGYAKHFWNWVFEQTSYATGVERINNAAVQSFFCLDASTVTNGKQDGDLFLEHVIDFLTRLKKEWGDLPPLNVQMINMYAYRFAIPCYEEWYIAGSSSRTPAPISIYYVC